MAWTIEYTATARKQLRKLGLRDAQRILDYMEARVAIARNPRTMGKPLGGPLGNLWRYRVGNCRVITESGESTRRGGRAGVRDVVMRRVR